MRIEVDTHSAIRHLERRSSKTHEGPDMKPTIEMINPTAEQDPHPTTLETDNAQAGIVIGRTSAGPPPMTAPGRRS
jgi:hypothetical protein